MLRYRLGTALAFVGGLWFSPLQVHGQALGQFVRVPGVADSTMVVILPDSAAMRFASADGEDAVPGCRVWPGRRTGVWRLDAATVLALDSIVVRTVNLALQSIAAPAREYLRQYSGIAIAGRRLVYVNAIDAELARRSLEMQIAHMPDSTKSPLQRALEHASYPLVAADGGVANWGIIVDPMSLRIGGLAVNCGFDHRTRGPIGGPLVPPTA